jgi:hypothetical protein
VAGGTVNLPGYDSQNLEIQGSSTANDGFSTALTVYSGFTLRNIQMLALSIVSGLVVGRDTTRLVGNSESVNGIYARSPGVFYCATAIIEYEGQLSSLIYGDSGNIWLNGCTYTQIGMPVFKYFAASARSGSVKFLGSPTYNGSAVPTGSTYSISGTGQITYTDPNAPGGGTISLGTPGCINAKGVARALRLINSDGSMNSRGFGLNSVTKTGVGEYSLGMESSGSAYVPIACLYGSSYKGYSLTVKADASGFIVYTTNNSGAAADASFYISIF